MPSKRRTNTTLANVSSFQYAPGFMIDLEKDMAHKTRAEWLSLIESFTQSGLTQTAFCTKHQLNPKYFSLKRTKLIGRDKTSAFLRIRESTVRSSTQERIVVKYGAVSIELSGTNPPGMIADLVKALV